MLFLHTKKNINTFFFLLIQVQQTKIFNRVLKTPSSHTKRCTHTEPLALYVYYKDVDDYFYYYYIFFTIFFSHVHVLERIARGALVTVWERVCVTFVGPNNDGLNMVFHYESTHIHIDIHTQSHLPCSKYLKHIAIDSPFSSRWIVFCCEYSLYISCILQFGA